MPIQKNGLSQKKLKRGARLKNDEVQEPIIVHLTYPNDVMPEFFEFPLLLRDDLLKDILDFGVDNLDIYGCELIDRESGKVWSNYKVANIIGLVDVFDMHASELHPDSPSEEAYLFNEIVIDQSKADGHHIFRPYGRQSEMMVSEELKNYLESKEKYPHLHFVAPEDFA